MGIGCDHKTKVSRFFFVCFDVVVIRSRMEKKWFMAMKGPIGALFYMGPRFEPFCVLLLKK